MIEIDKNKEREPWRDALRDMIELAKRSIECKRPDCPICNERRARIARAETLLKEVPEEAMADAALWRDAVRTADVCGQAGAHCPWCGVHGYPAKPDIEAHAVDCPWRLAQ